MYEILESVQLVLTILGIFISKCAKKSIFNLYITVKLKII